MSTKKQESLCNRILKIISEKTGFSVQAIIGKSRNQDIVLARRMLVQMCSDHVGVSSPLIAKIMGRDSHVFVAPILKDARKTYVENTAYAKLYNAIKGAL